MDDVVCESSTSTSFGDTLVIVIIPLDSATFIPLPCAIVLSPRTLLFRLKSTVPLAPSELTVPILPLTAVEILFM